MPPRSSTPKKPAARAVSAGTKKQADEMEKALATPASPTAAAAAAKTPAAKKATPKKAAAKKGAAAAEVEEEEQEAAPVKKIEVALASAKKKEGASGLFDDKPRVYSRATTRRLDDLAGLLVILVGTIYMVSCGYFLYREFMIDGKSAIPSFGSNVGVAPPAQQKAKAVPAKPTKPATTGESKYQL